VGISYEPQVNNGDEVINSDAEVKMTNGGLKGHFRVGNNTIPIRSSSVENKAVNGHHVSAVRDHTITAENGDFTQAGFNPSRVRMKVIELNNLTGYIRDNTGKILFNMVPENDFASAEAARNYLIQRVI
jgi:hypothetical protein